MDALLIERARVMGSIGAPATEGERLAFEAWMHGHCWSLFAEWRDGEYPGYYGPHETRDYFCPHATRTRMMWAAWRDRAALAESDPLRAQLVEALKEGRRAIGTHDAPHDCYATGPMTGNEYRDLVECPACSFIEMHDAAPRAAGVSL